MCLHVSTTIYCKYYVIQNLPIHMFLIVLRIVMPKNKAGSPKILVSSMSPTKHFFDCIIHCSTSQFSALRYFLV